MSHRIGRMRILLLALVLVFLGGMFVAAPSSLAAPAPSAQAVAMLAAPPAGSCYGDWCSGRDPSVEGCDRDAVTFAHDYSYGLPYFVELRWSPRCKTQWARVSAAAWPGGDTLGVVQPSTGYQQSGVSGSNGTYVWSRMIYSPVRCVYAWWNDAGWEYNQTACV